MPFIHFALFIIFIEHQFKMVLKQSFIFFFIMTMHYTSNLLGRKEKKENPTIESGEI
jgi:hypothetical protein